MHLSPASPLWDSVKNLYSDFNIETFRKIGSINDRLGTWGAIDSSSRYYKALMYEFAMYLDDLTIKSNKAKNLISLLEKIPNQSIGLPPTIKLGAVDVSLDYLLAVEEYLFCSDAIIDWGNVCEIGAGFGRTCHALMSLCEISQYSIIDLPEVLELSSTYLSKVLPKEEYSKIRFVSSVDFGSLKEIGLVINIDSLQEMPLKVGQKYLDFVSMNARSFFSKNAIGKYSPLDINLTIKNTDEYTSAMQMGLIRDVIPLFDTVARVEAVKKYHQIFCPEGFELKSSQRGFGQYLSYELSLFAKSI